MRKRAPVDWELNAALRKKGARYVRGKLDPDRNDHVCFFVGKKHCRVCGERELNIWLDTELFWLADKGVRK